MADTTQRVLQLLGLLQARTTWQAHKLAAELGVTERTIRRDITRLRDLGYPVHSSRGLDGGYQLGAGRHLPPLLLDDSEAIALVASLRMKALSGTDEFGEAALRALAKLDHVMPPRLRAITHTLEEASASLHHEYSAAQQRTSDLKLLQQLTNALRDRVLVRFTYHKPSANPTEREVEPTKLLTQGEYWYLQAFDRGRNDRRTFRLDRITNLHVTTWTFTPRAAPPPALSVDIAQRFRCAARVQLAAAPEEVAARIPSAYRSEIEATDHGSRFVTGAPNWDDLAWHLLWVCRDLDTHLLLDASPEADNLRDALRRIAADAHDAEVNTAHAGTHDPNSKAGIDSLVNNIPQK